MKRLTKIALMLLLVFIPFLIGANPAMASDTFPAIFNSVYPASQSANNASCQLCHTTSTSQLNGYGKDFAVQFRSSGIETSAFAAIEGLNSDGASLTNLQEITASAQPGWTPGANNTTYNRSTLAVLVTNAVPPANVTGNLDPPVATNLPPIARATANQVAVNVGQSVSLSGSTSSDPEGHALTYSWSLTRPAGSTAVLSATNIVNPTFIPDVAGSYTATLVVNDGTQNSPSASVTITASVPNLPPVANAGSAQTVTVGVVVTLNGSASTDPEGHVLTYSWSLLSKPTGSAATLANAATVSPTFTADLAGTYTAQLVVNDGTQNSPPTSVTITANPAPNLPPVAKLVASTLAPNVGQLVTLDGSGSSDPEGHALTYTWLLVSGPSGSTATLAAGADAAHKTLTPDVPGSYVVRLTVNDGAQNSSPVTVTIGALQNLPPVANPGAPQTVTVGATVQLNGSGSSDPEGHSLAYAWVFVSKPVGSTATLSATNIVNPTFTADVAGQYVVGLVVNDSVFNSPQVNVVITVNAPVPVNHAPTVTNPGNKTVTVGQLLSFTITGSDPDGNALTFAATSTLPTGATLSPSGAFSWTPATGQASGTPYSVTVTASDNGTPAMTSAPVTFTITVQAAPPPPTTGGAVDFDIISFRATREVELSERTAVRFQLVVSNVSSAAGAVPATLVGMRNGFEVYRKTLTATAAAGKGASLVFPSYTPKAAGNITWTVTLLDSGPAHNTATATTQVEGGGSSTRRD